MELWQALILGLVEGLTEFLPVSSTGHLLVTQRLLGIGASEAANAYVIAIQAGAIAAVLGLYRKRVAQMALGLLGWRVVAAIALFVVGNVLTFALELLVAGVQALRLEYYELFSRIFTAEGRRFRPWSPVPAGGAALKEGTRS